MSEQDDGSAKARNLPITSPAYVPPAPRPEDPPTAGWKIATGVLAVTTVLALGWGIMQTNSLQGEVDTLQVNVQKQELVAEAASESAKSQVDRLGDQVKVLADTLKVLKKQAGNALEGAADEQKKLKKQLTKTEDAVTELKKEVDSSDSDSAAFAAAYEEVQAELVATQKAMAELLSAVAEETHGKLDF